MPSGIGLPQILILLVIVLIIFGPKRLPELGRSLGRGITEFKNGLGGNHDDNFTESTAIEEPPAASATEAQAEEKSSSSG